MQLMTKTIEMKLSRFPYRSQEGKGLEAEVIVKYFGGSNATWLVTEGDQQEDGDWEFSAMSPLTDQSGSGDISSSQKSGAFASGHSASALNGISTSAIIRKSKIS